jgi:hypothetical protein
MKLYFNRNKRTYVVYSYEGTCADCLQYIQRHQR